MTVSHPSALKTAETVLQNTAHTPEGANLARAYIDLTQRFTAEALEAEMRRGCSNNVFTPIGPRCRQGDACNCKRSAERHSELGEVMPRGPRR
jgi:hypothetical protein